MTKKLKHAIIILAHTDLSQLSRLINSLDDNFTFFIHLDKKINYKEFVEVIKNAKSNVFFYRWKHITWGGIGIVKTQLRLIKIALSVNKFDYFHLLSGQDYPIASIFEIVSWFERHNGLQFIEYHTLPFEKWENGTFDRFLFFRLNDWLDYTSKKGREIIDKVTSFQIKHRIYRRIPNQYPKLYGGSNWMSFTGDCAKMLVNPDRKARRFLRRLRFTFASDEVYFQTVILNSKFADSVVNDNKRHIMWKNGGVKILGRFDLWDIATSNALFARKIVSNYSEKLLALMPLIIKSEARINYSRSLACKIVTFARLLNLDCIFDFNGGIGLYVKQLRDSGIRAYGFTNCYSYILLSSYIFSDGFTCQFLDFTRIVNIEIQADLTMSVFSELDLKLIDNNNLILSLIQNSKKYILFAYNKIYNDNDNFYEKFSNLNYLFKSNGFYHNIIASKWLSGEDGDGNIVEVVIYEKI